MFYMNFVRNTRGDMLILIKASFNIHDLLINHDLSANIILILLCKFNYWFHWRYLIQIFT